MKKLMTMIAAVAMSFGLYAADPYSISFETADGCTQGEALNKTEWTVPEGATATVVARTLDYNYQTSGDARRTDLFENTNDNSLKLETGSGKVVCTPGNVVDGIFFDQVVKFTGYEEPPTVTEGKIAVWMSAIEADDQAEPPVIGKTNMFITCGTLDATGKIDSKTIDLGAYDIDATHRVTLKSLGAVTEGGVAGFIVYIDGAQVVKTDAEYIVAEAQILPAFSSYNASGMLFPALEAGTVATVAYQGIGELDDVAIDELGPEFARFVEGTVAQIPDAELVVTDENGDEIPVTNNKFQAAPGSTITLTYTADDGKFLTGGKETWTSDQIITQDNKDFTDLVKDVEALTKVAQYNDEDAEPTFTDSLQEALNLSAEDDEVVLLVDTELTDTLVVPAEFGAGTLTLGNKTITLAADKTVGIQVNAAGVAIQNGKIVSARETYGVAYAILNNAVDATYENLEIDATNYKFGLTCDSAGDLAAECQDPATVTVNCKKVDITGNGGLFYAQHTVLNLDANCSAIATGTPQGYAAAVYSALNSLVNIASGTYAHTYSLISGNLGGKITVTAGTFTGDIKSFMKVGAHEELEGYDGYKAVFTFNGGEYDGDIVFEDANARTLDKFVKVADVEIDPPAGYQWNEVTGVLEAVPPTPETYDITIAEVKNGTLETSVTNDVAAGTTVTVKAEAAEGYELESITTNGQVLAGTSFEMPAEAVTVAATFKAVQTDPWPDPKEDKDVADAIEKAGFSDTAKACFTTVQAYNDFKAYCIDTLKLEDPAIVGSNPKANALVSYALDCGMLENEIKADDVKINDVAFTGSVAELEVTIVGVTPGANVKPEVLAKVLTAQGGEAVNSLSADNVVVSGQCVETGKIKVTVTPKTDNPAAFFYRAEINK